jgi:hypothetical protein
MATKSPLQKFLKRNLHPEDKNKHSVESMGIIKPQEKDASDYKVAQN